jgi:ribonuclease T2
MARLSSPIVIACCALALLFTGASPANAQRRTSPDQKEFAYYMLVLSYAPDFCAQPQGDKDPRECGKGRQVSFVVHGLWPQGETTRGPERCGSARPVSQAIVQATLKYIPTESLIQHEWSTHGTCSGLSAQDYFAALRKARDSVSIPAEFSASSGTQSTSPSEVESKLASANPAFPAGAFRTSCYPDGELQEVRVCMNKDLSPRPCGPSAGECRSRTVTLLPVR